MYGAFPGAVVVLDVDEAQRGGAEGQRHLAAVRRRAIVAHHGHWSGGSGAQLRSLPAVKQCMLYRF